MTITPSRALPVHSAVMSRIGINLVEGKAARERTGHRPRVLKCYFSLSNIFYSHLSCVQNSHYYYCYCYYYYYYYTRHMF